MGVWSGLGQVCECRSCSCWICSPAKLGHSQGHEDHEGYIPRSFYSTHHGPSTSPSPKSLQLWHRWISDLRLSILAQVSSSRSVLGSFDLRFFFQDALTRSFYRLSGCTSSTYGTKDLLFWKDLKTNPKLPKPSPIPSNPFESLRTYVEPMSFHVLVPSYSHLCSHRPFCRNCFQFLLADWSHVISSWRDAHLETWRSPTLW